MLQVRTVPSGQQILIPHNPEYSFNLITATADWRGEGGGEIFFLEKGGPLTLP